MKKPDQSDLSIALSQKKPTKKISLLRVLMPEINEAIHRGLSKKEIWDSFQSAGMGMSYKMFINYLLLIRKSDRPSPEPVPVPINKTATPIPKQQEMIGENEMCGLSPLNAALAEMRQQPEVDYSKIFRDHLKSRKKPMP